ncbi:hypothetical protein FNV43_RR26704 [Rhamnella rubrinervis]|uniref:Uncharacterized protein n=1 Tax=Rhamnella rubrinervis TaxID=2594499 RepID=A0A8K0GPG6_9ROSA|nr:hypothetical protein FNV43_RR26704 [Rhamnella rubrinervis]
MQRLKTPVIKKTAILSGIPIDTCYFKCRGSNLLTVYDKDTLTVDDKMGEAEIDIKPYIDCLKMGLENLPNGCVVKRFSRTGQIVSLTRAIVSGTMEKSFKTCV